MSGQFSVSFILRFADQGSSLAARAMQTITRGMKDVEGVAKSTSSAAIASFRKLGEAREVLGIRSEKAIQNEIRQTEAAYKRLAESGQASARELERAQDAMRDKVARLRSEMERVNQTGGRMRSVFTGIGAGVAAYQAGKHVLADPIRQTMSYDRQIAGLANTAYAGESLDARRAGMRTLDAAINASVRAGGGSREAALATLDKLVASGAFTDVREAARLLPVLTKGGTASGADPALLADIAIRGKQTLGLSDTGLAIDQAIVAGQRGGFELKDMAKWLPQQMALARQAGMRGDAGFRKLLAANQAVAITAGSKDEAGNNLVNLLAKINSQDTANDAKKLGIDLSGSLAAARAKGTDSLDAFVNLVELQVSKDKRYTALREKARNAKGDEQRAAFESMGDILQGSAIGKLVQDRQALMALVGIMNNRKYVGDIFDQTGQAKGAADANFALIADTPSFKTEQLAAEKAISMQTAMDKVNPLLGQMADHLAASAREHPILSAAIAATTTALTALAAAAGAASLGVLIGRGGGGAAAGAAGAAGIGATVSRFAAGAGRLGASALGAVASYFPAAMALAGAGAVGYGVGTVANAGINGLTGWASNGKHDSLASLLHDLLNREKEPAKVAVTVKVENGNLVAEVNQANEQHARRR